jgi:abhydrolase domain-containing protein 17
MPTKKTTTAKSVIPAVCVRFIRMWPPVHTLLRRPPHNPEQAAKWEHSESTFDVQYVETVDDARIAIRYLPNPDARHTVLFSHGNAEDLGNLDSFLRRMHEQGFAVIGYDYRGYGMSERRQTTAGGVLRDIEAVYRFALDSLGVSPRDLIVHGRSVGTGPSLHLAAHHEIGGLVIESGFMSAFRVLTRWRILPFDRFNNLSLLPQIDVPVLIIHGAEDRIISPRHGRRLYRAASEPKSYWEVEGAGHNNLSYVAGREYWERLAAFARRLES